MLGLAATSIITLKHLLRSQLLLSPDFWHDRYNEDRDWPDEYKDWFFRTLAWNDMCKKVEGLEALRDVLQEEDTSCEQCMALFMLSAQGSTMPRRLFYHMRVEFWLARLTGGLLNRLAVSAAPAAVVLHNNIRQGFAGLLRAESCMPRTAQHCDANNAGCLTLHRLPLADNKDKKDV